MDPEYDVCQKLVQRYDKDRFLTALFAPAEKRPALFALYAFNAEVTRVRDMVSDPLPGEMRYQWWRDALGGVEHGNVRDHPIARAMIDTTSRYALPEALLSAFLEARTFDLYDDPMEDLSALEDYCRDTAGALVELAGHILSGPITDERMRNAACHAGIAYGLTAILRALPYHAVRGKLYLPLDMLDRVGISPDDVLSGRCGAALHGVLKDLRERARFHLTRMHNLVDAVPPAASPALLPICLVDTYLAAMEQPGYDPFVTIVEVPQWRRQWVIWRAARRARAG